MIIVLASVQALVSPSVLLPTPDLSCATRCREPPLMQNWAIDWLAQSSPDKDKSKTKSKSTARQAAKAERDARSQRLAAEARAAAQSQITASIVAELDTTPEDEVATSAVLRIALSAAKAAAEAAEVSAAATAQCQAAVAQEAKLAASAAAALSAVSAHLADAQELEEVLLLEVRTARKFLLRGRGLMDDFRRGSPARQKSLVRGVMDNFVAVQEAIVAAEAVDATTDQVLAEARRVAEELASCRTQMLSLSLVENAGERKGAR